MHADFSNGKHRKLIAVIYNSSIKYSSWLGEMAQLVRALVTQACVFEFES